MPKTALIVTFDFPPSSSAAVQRTLKMVDYLKDFGWNCVILTAKSTAYERLETSQKIPSHVEQHIYRTFAFDVQRDFSIKGKHFSWMKGIDRWSSWIPGAILCGSKLLKKYKFDAIISTVPIPSSHIVAGYLAKKSGLPWMADYQDPMSYLYEPTNWFRKFCHQKIDKMVTTNASAIVFATKQAMNLYQNSYPDTELSKFHYVENGFDESNFQSVNNSEAEFNTPFQEGKFSFYYSGVLYPNGRDPVPFFKALAFLSNHEPALFKKIEVIFQGAGTSEKFEKIISSLGIENTVKFLPPVSYLESIYNMKNANALVVIQDEVFNLQVPGKLYEYIRVGAPILVITPYNSATATVAQRVSKSYIANNTDSIINQIRKITYLNDDICCVSENSSHEFNESIEEFSRYCKAREFACILDKITFAIQRS